MLAKTLQQQKCGVDIGIACVKNFPNAEYSDLVQQIRHIPCEKNNVRGIDIDEILRQNPQVVVIDDFHESNTPNSKYQRRYQEIQVLLNAGIDIYSTLSIYFLESLADIIEKLTGIRFEKTVPDRLLEQATSIELVDVPVETVLWRLQHKMISSPDPLQRDYLFKEGTLNNLRQLTFRHVSHWIETHHQKSLNDNVRPSALALNEHIMVCISSSPLSAKLIRTSFQLARDIQAEWTAVYVEKPRDMENAGKNQKQLIQNMHLVEQLGGKVVTIHGNSVSDTLFQYAKQHDITKIVVGYPVQSRWYSIGRKSIIDRLIQQNSDIDIYVINSGQPQENIINFITGQNPIKPGKYLLTFAVIMVTTLLDIFIRPFVFPATLVTLYLLGISATAVYLGYRPALIATILSVLSFFFFFVPHTVASPIGSLPYLIVLIGLLFAGFIVTGFITGALDRANTADHHANQMMELYSLSRDLSTTIAFDGIIETIMTHVKQTFQADVCLYLNEANSLVQFQATAGFPQSPTEALAAQEAYRLVQSTGMSTLSHSEAEAIYKPLRTAHQKIGVIGVSFSDNRPLTLEQHRLLDAFANQVALVIEANRLAEQAHEARLVREREKLQAALLDSISHDIRTPLVSITGALSSLRDEANLFDEEMRVELLDDAWLETERLNRLVENLLEMSRLQSGELKLNREWHDPDEIIAVARGQLRERLRDYKIITHIQKDISLIYVDFTLMVQVLVNLLDNAAKYTLGDKTIEICTMSKPSCMVFQIADMGKGIPEAELPHIFNKFYRASNVQSVNGTGLGLSICTGIVEAHNGKIRAYNRLEGGAIFEVELPLENNNL